MPSQAVALVLLAVIAGSVLSLESFSHPLRLSSHRRDKLQLLYEAEWNSCKDHPHLTPSCRRIQRLREESRLQDRVRSYHDEIYSIAVSAGTPAQQFELGIDTGSRRTWLSVPECTSCETNETIHHDRKKFIYSQSSTYRTNHTTDKAFYGGRGSVSGFVAKDTVDIGSRLILSNQDVLLVDNMTHMEYYAGDGILGISFPRRGAWIPPLSVIENNTDVIKQFTVFLRKNEAEETMEGGTITWNSIDKNNCESEAKLVYLSHLEDEDKNAFGLWAFELTAITYPGTRVDPPELEVWVAISDTGAGALLGPVDAFSDFIEGQLKATRDSETNKFRTSCATNFLPLTFVIGKDEYTVLPEQYVVKNGSECFLKLDFSTQGKGEADWILGTPLIRSYCHTYDIANARIAIAEHK